MPASSREVFFGWSWFSRVKSSLCLEKPLPGKHFLLYHLIPFLLLWLSQGLLCCFSQHTLSPPSLCNITCHGTFLPLLSSRSMLYYVNLFHLPFNLPGSLIFAIVPLQGTWGLMCLLMVLLWATLKFIIFLKSRNNFTDQIFLSKHLPKFIKLMVAIPLSMLGGTQTARNCPGRTSSQMTNGANF